MRTESPRLRPLFGALLASATMLVAAPAAYASPVASFSGPSAANAGQPVTFDASGATADSGQTLTYTWDFGDGGSEITANATVGHTFTVPGPHTVKLTVSDPGGSNSTSSTVTVDGPPIASFTTPAGPFATGAAVAFDATASIDPDGSIVGYAWSFGDGSTGTGLTTNHAYSKGGTYIVTLTVTDNAGLQSAISAAVTVTAAPTTTSANGPAGGSTGPARIARTGATQTLALDNGLLLLTGQALSCPKSIGPCAVTIKLTTRVSVSSGRSHRRTLRTLTIGSAKVTTPAGGRSPLTVHLNRQGISLLTQRHLLRASVSVVARPANGAALRSTTAATLNLPAGFGRTRSRKRSG